MRGRKKRIVRILNDLNLTNMVDVIFTLLIIFMITAPMLTQGVQVDLPQTDSKNVESSSSIQVAVNERNEIFIEQERVSLPDFNKRFTEVFAKRTHIPVFIHADKKAPYGLVAQIISDIQNGGAVKLGFITLPNDPYK
ncbi:MAG: biopolymer transporter ExbD [bacterium]